MRSSKQKYIQKILFWGLLVGLLYVVSKKGLSSLDAIVAYIAFGLVLLRGIVLSHLLLDDFESVAKKKHTTPLLLFMGMILRILVPGLVIAVILTYVLYQFWYPHLLGTR